MSDKTIRGFLLLIAIITVGLVACNYTEGECWYYGEGTENAGAGVGVGSGGGVFIPTGPAGVGGFGDQPPKQPQDASNSSPKCNEEEEDALFANCSLRVNYPHESTHEPGTVNVVAKVECNRAVESIEMKLGLARDFLEVASRTVTNSGVAALEVNVATSLPCVPGDYQGAAAARVTFPPTAMPASDILNANSATRPVTCK